MKGYTIRPLQPQEVPLLDTFLYEAIFLPPGAQPPPRSIIRLPELQVYVQDFGASPHDRCLVAEGAEGVIGAAWARIMQDYGHIDEETPSLAIALLPDWRGQGIGTALLTRLLEELAGSGYAKVSLSVQKANPAARLYARLGFEVLEEREEELRMVCKLQEIALY